MILIQARMRVTQSTYTRPKKTQLQGHQQKKIQAAACYSKAPCKTQTKNPCKADYNPAVRPCVKTPSAS